MVPAGVPTSFVPSKARPTHVLPDGKGKDVDRGGTIFDTDDRYLFDDTSFPWRTTGKVRTEGQWGSGTTIGPRLVLTASHVINWTGGDEGGVSWVTFTPGYFDGSGPWGEIAATHVIYWIQAPGTLSDEQTAFDYVVLVMADRIGDVVGYPGYRTYDERWNGESYWQYIGYPGELSSGERPAFQGDGRRLVGRATTARAGRPATSWGTSTSSPRGSRAASCGAGGATSRGRAWSGSAARSAAPPCRHPAVRPRATTSTAAARR